MADKNISAKSFIDKTEKTAESIEKNVQSMTLDKMNEAPKQEVEQQTKMSQKEIEKTPDFYLKPKKRFHCKAKFNEAFRSDYNYQKEYVQFIAENREIIGESIEAWTKPFPGIDAEFWEVPVNRPVWGPRYLAEQIKKASYHRLKMAETVSDSNLVGSYGGMNQYGRIVAESTIQRLDAIPVSKNKSIFMGASGF